MARLALVASILLGLAGCGAGLSANSSQSLGQAAVDGLFYGGAALASAGRAPTDRVPTYSEPSGPELDAPDRDFVCTSGGEETIVRARSVSEARGDCHGAVDCACVDRTMHDELARYGQ